MTNPKHPLAPPIRNPFLNRVVTRLSGLKPLMAAYDRWLAMTPPGERPVGHEFLDYGLDFIGAEIAWDNPEQLRRIPQDGPVVVASNHPLGGLEGMLMTRELLRRRDDVKVLTNHLLLQFKEFADLFIGVEVFDKQASQVNTRGIREACKHLQNGGLLLVFPAGAVATINSAKRRIEDRPWNNLVGRLARRYRATCIPIHLQARNSFYFYLAGMIHRRLRTMLLPRQLANKKGRVIEARAGELLSAADIRKMSDADAVTQSLRLASDLLAHKRPAGAATFVGSRGAAIATDVAVAELEAQMRQLETYRLIDHDTFSVYCAPFDELGCVMRQIAICREQTFRAAGEGTGRALDSDAFDSAYWHLWVWDRDARCIVGGYRLGKTDEIIREHGAGQLYTHTQYHFDQSFLTDLGNPLEVGRSFVTLDYQRHPRALDLLWRGIGAFVVQNPDYHTLFGCVSISSEYSELARAFLADTLMRNFSAQHDWLRRVTPRAPLQVKDKLWTAADLAPLNNIGIANKLLGNLDRGKDIPVLFRHYLTLNGRFVAFSVNEQFNHSLNGLILVDLRQTPERYLQRYLGKQGCSDFLDYWGVTRQEAA